MKKILVIICAAVTLVACEKPVFDSIEDVQDEEVNVDALPKKKFTFTVKGDFGAATFTRGYLQAEGQSMTDLWVFDYVDDVCVQSVHKTKEDDDFGKPVMQLAYGHHHVYFVASRGETPTLDADGHTIVWDTPKDTFWKDYDVTVVSTSNGNRAVTLDRVATRLRIVVNDEVPANCASVCVTPAKWYYGIDYVAGTPVSSQAKERVVSVPASYLGTTGQLAVSIFGISGSDEWTTSFSVKAKDTDNNVVGSVSVSGAPFKANRSTDYGGNLFASNGGLDVSINDEWEQAFYMTW